MEKRYCNECSELVEAVCPVVSEGSPNRPPACILDSVAVSLPLPAKAWELRRGGVYALRFDRSLTCEVRAAVIKAVDEYAEKVGVKFVVLEDCSIAEAPANTEGRPDLHGR